MEIRQNDIIKYTKGIFKKYLLFFPIILLLVTLSIIFNFPGGIIGLYLSFSCTYIHKKTTKEAIIEHLFRLLTFFISYKIVVMFLE